MVTRVLLLAVLVLPLLAAGCSASCSNVSEKLYEECDVAWQLDFSGDDFERQCQQMQEHYEERPEEEAFQEVLRCLWTTDCEVLEQDPTACHDGEIYIAL